uniref:Uncharacterized protein n=1 Tax=Sus scrofa TaxID=9823 RepID=A0A4X1TZI9_PIG
MRGGGGGPGGSESPFSSTAGREPRQVSVPALHPQELPQARPAVPLPVRLHGHLPALHPHHLPSAGRRLQRGHHHQAAGSEGAHMEAVERIPGEILLPSVPADCRICLGLAGGPLLDVTVSHRQCHVTLSSGIILLLEDLVKK